MNFQPDESQLNCLKTWYPVDNPLHLDPRHAVIKLAGEAGEILDLYGKHEYKPNFDWMNCKYCGYELDWHNKGYWTKEACHGNDSTPLILDELGDYSYYLRILAYQKGVSFEELCECGYIPDYKLDMLLAMLNEQSGKSLREYVELSMPPSKTILEYLSRIFLSILVQLDTPLQSVLDLNYKKLNSEPTNHGWRNAKMKTIADCPPMNPK